MSFVSLWMCGLREHTQHFLAVQDHALRAAAADAPLQEEVSHLVLRGQAKDTGNSVHFAFEALIGLHEIWDEL